MTRDQHTIAVIDDDYAILNALDRFLRAHGYSVELYSTTAAFLRAAKSTTAKCLIVDCQIGSHSGIQMIRDLLLEGIQFPTIFVTGCSDDDFRTQAVALNCVAYLQKPVDTGRLAEAVMTAIER